MESVESYLLNNGYVKVYRLDTLKITNRARNDKRYFLAEDTFGLHISGARFTEQAWKQLKEGTGYDKIRQLNVLYLVRLRHRL